MDTTTRRTSPTRRVDAVAERLHSVALHLLRRLRAEDDALGLTPPRLAALSAVVRRGLTTIGDLAASEGVRPPTMTRLVDGLERDGLVVREPHLTDRRAVNVRATPAGTRMVRGGRTRRIQALAERLERLPPRDLALLASASDVLDRVLEQADDRSGAASASEPASRRARRRPSTR